MKVEIGQAQLQGCNFPNRNKMKRQLLIVISKMLELVLQPQCPEEDAKYNPTAQAMQDLLNKILV